MKYVICTLLLLTSTAFGSSPKLVGSVTSQNCPEKMAKLWISEKESNQLIYQADVPTKSSFEVRLIPGKYKIILNNQKGCLSEVEIEINKSDVLIKREFVLKSN